MSLLFINKNLQLNNLKTRIAMNAKISVFVVCIETIICLLLYNLDDCTFKDTQREKAPLNQNSSTYKKYEYGHLGRWYIKSALYKRFSSWNKSSKIYSSYWQNSVLFDWSILYSPFLTLASDTAVLYGNGVFSISVLSTKKWFSSFLKNVCFEKNLFQS